MPGWARNLSGWIKPGSDAQPTVPPYRRTAVPPSPSFFVNSHFKEASSNKLVDGHAFWIPLCVLLRRHPPTSVSSSRRIRSFCCHF